jgi:hypothetical protein
VLLVGALAVACGDGDESATPTPTPPSSATTAAGAAPTLEPPPERGDDEVALIVVSGSTQYQPTVAEFRELPTAEAEGSGPEGVTLAELGARVEAREGAVVTVEGRSKDFSTVRYWRGTLAEAGTTMVVSLEDAGLARLAGSLIAEDAWIYAVETVSFE